MFINQTPNNLETNLAANLHLGKKIKIFTLCGFCPLFIILGIAVLILDPAEPITPIFFFILAALFAVFYLFLFKPILKRTIKKQLNGMESENTFCFEDDHFTIQTTSKNGLNSSATGVYGCLTKVEEYDDMWLFFYNKINLFILLKDGMTEGTVEDFSVFLHVKLSDRLIVKTKKRV